MDDDDERVEPASESMNSFDQISGPPTPAVSRSQWTTREILVRVLIAVVIVLVMVGALLIILSNVFNVLSD
ncbi:hypothetical protein [Nitrolancea hollandica]|uniref:Uncharacterized protein n=1 Tax=Nitrolancea hollandica Lb TaxID=1129897 RepID=I4EJA7_9BACT|nr:hypothetical protein [Nitrolancea hollandica]CCF84769.1 hypothetical protein NITHO_3910002 [Nitrolancea hollandica Lb]